MKLPTASALARVAACPPSAVLPRSNRTTVYAKAGNVLHAFLQRCQEVGRDDALAEQTPDVVDAMAAIDTDALPVNGSYAAEVAFAFDLVTGKARELGRGLNRDYSGRTATEVCGTADVVGLTADAVYVGDFKSGYLDIPSARDGWQSRFLSLCAARAYGRDNAISDVIRVRPDETPWTDRARFDGFDLAMTESALRSVIDEAKHAGEMLAFGTMPTVTEGDHCRYCASIDYCPAKTALVRSLGAPTEMATVEDLVGELTPATAGAAHRRVKAIESVVALVKSRIYDLARSHPIPLGDGQFLGETTAPGDEELDGEGTYQVVRALYGDEYAEIVAPPLGRAAAKTRIKTAMRKLKGLGKLKTIKAGEDDLIGRLREAGCARKPIVTKVREFTAPECRNDGCSEMALRDGGTCAVCSIDAEHSERQSA